MADILKYISEPVAEKIQQQIIDSGENEVFFVGYTDENLVVTDIDVVARGNEISVPAVLKVAQDADVVIHNHPSGLLKPSQADVNIASYLDQFSVAFYIVNNFVDDIYVVIEPFSKKVIEPLEIEKIEKLLDENGTISKALKGFEKRPQQIEMIDAVVNSFNEKKVAMIEAGTGTGKTMAYLLPAVHWAVQNKQRIVISTNTINLQEQLIKKDIPFLQKVLDINFEAVLVKGRGNYVCLRKVDEIESEFESLAEDDEHDELTNLVDWARQSKDGSKSDLAYEPRYTVWEKIAAESDTCTRNKCKHFRECFVNKARRNANRAHIIVANHHLLFADLAIRSQSGSVTEAAVLPPYNHIIFDEAHHLENVATNYFGSQASRIGIIRLLNRLHRQRKSLLKGYLHTIRYKLIREKNVPKETAAEITSLISDKAVPKCVDLVDATNEIMDFLYDVLQTVAGNGNEQEVKLRILENNHGLLFNSNGLEGLFKEYVDSLKGFSIQVNQLLDQLNRSQKYFRDDWSSIIIELQAVAERLTAIAETIHDVVFNTDDENIRWLEAKRGYKSSHIVRFSSSPLHVNEMMNKAVYENYDTVIHTSATLTVDKKFKFWAGRIGLWDLLDERKVELILGSPFNYEKQVVMAIPKDMPDPNYHTFAEHLTDMVYKTINVSRGRAFVLFTSYGLLNMVFNQLQSSLEMQGIRVLKQGAMNRTELLNQFKNDHSSVLFATDSFWEGVDVVGDALECVIITKLPFRVPSEPVIEARYEAIEKNGGNPFMEYAVPMAVLKLKQGFGRLIRSQTDRGAVLILDNRVITKSYGKRFLRSLPVCHNIVDKRDNILTELKDFYSN